MERKIRINKDILIEEIQSNLFKEKDIKVYLQRDDLLHKDVSGNKWRKLEYALRHYDYKQYNGIVSFGGAFSNHLAATAAACKLLDIPFVAFIRGEEPVKNNPTILFLKEQGATLHWVSREMYRSLREQSWPNPNPNIYNQYLVIPEGGSTHNAIRSCMEMSNEWNNKYDYACCSIGTGTTFAGMVNGLEHAKTQSLGFIMLKDKNYLTSEIEKMTTHNNYELNRSYHFNGFAKADDNLVEFLNRFYKDNKIPLDPIYTGKLMYGIYDLVKNDYFPKGSKIIAVHTGGLQGILGFNEQRKSKGRSILNYK